MNPWIARLDGSGRWWCGPSWRARICALLLLAVVWGAVLGACGRRTPPKPVGSILPVPAGLVAWQRESQAQVAWRVPGKGEARAHEGLEGFVLRIERLPLNCPACAPDESRRLALPLHVESMVMEGGRAIYRFPLAPQPATWRFRVAARFGAGLGRESPPSLMDAPASVPVHQLYWEPSRGGDSELRAIRLYWKPRRESVVRTLTREGAMVEQDRLFRVNLFRRMEGAPWPLSPLNIQPLKTGGLTVQIPKDARVEFRMRLVDRFGNEGPASPIVAIGPWVGKR